jgi:hypothetical protein
MRHVSVRHSWRKGLIMVKPYDSSATRKLRHTTGHSVSVAISALIASSRSRPHSRAESLPDGPKTW